MQAMEATEKIPSHQEAAEESLTGNDMSQFMQWDGHSAHRT